MDHRLTRICALTGILTLAIGCGGGNGDGGMITPTAVEGFVSRDHSGVEITLTSDRQDYSVGQAMQMTMTVRNNRSNAVTFNFNNAMQYDFEADRTHRSKWEYSEGRTYGQTMTTFTLQPGESWVRAAQWDQIDRFDQPVGPGQIELRGIVTGTSASVPGQVLQDPTSGTLIVQIRP